MQKIGLFLGSFNPIHTGHLIIANEMAECADLSKVWLVISPQNPFKHRDDLLAEKDRFLMAQAAVLDHDKIEVSDVEFQLPKPSYTIHTLRYLSKKYPTVEFKLILGEDNLVTFHQWKDYEQILQNYELYVYPRTETQPVKLPHLATIKLISAPLLHISASYIRQRIKDQKSIRYLVPQVVEQLIYEKKFYR